MIKMCECSEDFPEEISNGIYICKYCGKDITDGKEKEMFRTNIDIN